MSEGAEMRVEPGREQHRRPVYVQPTSPKNTLQGSNWPALRAPSEYVSTGSVSHLAIFLSTPAEVQAMQPFLCGPNCSGGEAV